MYWRVMSVVFLVALGMSAWAGISLGNWLVSHGPVATGLPEILELPDTPVLDADGRPFTAQPPQPLPSGGFGIPETDTDMDWAVNLPSLAEQDTPPPIAIATTTITMDEARMIAQGDDSHLQGLANIGDLIDILPGLNQPESMEPAAPAADSGLAGESWQQALQQELDACSRLSFFQRPSCAWAARNKYCEPAQAWGKVANCPARSF